MTIRNFLTTWLSKCILRFINSSTKELFRKLERDLQKLTRTRFNLRFNEACLQHDLLPIFTNVKLYDSAAKPQEFVTSFRRKLVEHENGKHRTAIAELELQHNNNLAKLKDALSALRYEAALELLYRLNSKLEKELTVKHSNKLCRLYGSTLYQKQDICSVINLSNCQIPSNIESIFSLGMNCHLKQKFNYVQRKIEIEKLYERINRNVNDKLIIVQDDEKLKCDLKRHGLRDMHNHQPKDILTKQQYESIKDFRDNKDITIRKADKSNIFVILNRDTYINKVKSILEDTSKFQKLERDPTDKIKKSLSHLVTCANAKVDGIKLTKIVGHYTPSYIYCNPKIHKSSDDPPMRPIVSQIGTVTYNTAKEPNTIIAKYLPKQHMIESTYEFTEISKTVKCPKLIASLDVENLFTNVPVNETIKIIIDNVYNHTKLPPPDIPRNILEKLLKICTTETPFQAPRWNYLSTNRRSKHGLLPRIDLR